MNELENPTNLVDTIRANNAALEAAAAKREAEAAKKPNLVDIARANNAALEAAAAKREAEAANLPPAQPVAVPVADPNVVYADEPFVEPGYRLADSDLKFGSFRSENAYDSIQKDFKAKHGREMDYDVAVIRARLQAGEIDREGARNLALALRHRRDVQNARDTAVEYWKERVMPGETPYEKAEASWKEFFVDTSKIGVEVAKGRKQELIDMMNAAAGSDNAQARNMALARRFGLSEITNSVPIEDRDTLDLPSNYRKGSPGYVAAQKRLAMRALDPASYFLPGNAWRAQYDKAKMKGGAERFLARDDVKGVDANSTEGLLPTVSRYKKGKYRKVPTGRYFDKASADKLSKFLNPFYDDLATMMGEE